jgi:hypothetical protein
MYTHCIHYRLNVPFFFLFILFFSLRFLKLLKLVNIIVGYEGQVARDSALGGRGKV